MVFLCSWQLPFVLCLRCSAPPPPASPQLPRYSLPYSCIMPTGSKSTVLKSPNVPRNLLRYANCYAPHRDLKFVAEPLPPPPKKITVLFSASVLSMNTSHPLHVRARCFPHRSERQTDGPLGPWALAEGLCQVSARPYTI